MKTKKIDLSLEEARALYKSGNLQFKKLALSAFTESELTEVTFNEIIEQVIIDEKSVYIPREYKSEVNLLLRLAAIAQFYNKGWKRTCCNTGYFITPVSVTINNKHTYQLGVKSHCNVVHPGIIYFRRPEDAMYAIKMLNLNKYLNPQTCQIKDLDTYNLIIWKNSTKS